ncbi:MULTISPECIES: hypothetical protein [Bacillus cereus group]|uniref:hypothetical protein n=1 Tax=Bacillus cereus group TaxID=86661 RepID=UPI000BF76465|nr:MULTISPECIES: hypothetical protein [Bacillus cereus group]PGA17207.1 hypothetical protein COL80_29985 [Bacillus thuringiensis]PGU85379.1 hypothetical protein COD76_06740 [Bacillus cereus]
MWENVVSFFQNNWVISILAGALVTMISEMWKRWRSRTSYWQKVNLANRDILNTIESFTSEKDLPNVQILMAFHSSTARNYKISLKDIYPLDEVVDDLIRKIIESNFLSYAQKIDSSERLLNLKEDIVKIPLANEIPDKVKEIDKLDKGRLFSITSMLVGLITTVLFMFLFLFKSNNSLILLTNSTEIISSVLAIATVSIGLIYTFMVVEKMTVKKDKDKKDIDKKDIDKKDIDKKDIDKDTDEL